MNEKILVLLLFCLNFQFAASQTTDLAINVQAQNLSGNTISQIPIFGEFQYLVTISNSGNSVSNATFSLQLNSNATIMSIASQNPINGASLIPTNEFSITASNLITATVSGLPNNSSLQVKIILKAPIILGGIAANASVFPPNGTQDVNLTNNQSIISIDVTDVVIDFSITHAQITPPQGTAINSWNDSVIYTFTITNNSSIDYPVNAIGGSLTLLSPIAYGRPIVKTVAINCVGSSNQTECFDTPNAFNTPSILSSEINMFSLLDGYIFTSGGSLTFEVEYQFLNPTCALELGIISVESKISIELDHANASPSVSNAIVTNLLNAELCIATDVCIETVQTNPSPTTVVNWGQEVTFETTICNNGPLDASIQFFLQNLTLNIEWDIVSVLCTGTTGPISCSDILLTDQNSLWSSNVFMIPVGATITIETVVIFLEPECSSSIANTIALVRSGVNLLSLGIIDSNPLNNNEIDNVTLPPTSSCPLSDLQITKTQTNPALPEGNSPINTTEWGSITYQITVNNPSNFDAVIQLFDYMPLNFPNINQYVTGTLLSVNCISTTGTATCYEIEHANIGVILDGVPESGSLDIFWEILPEDNWVLPAQSSITFEAIVDWSPECTSENITATNSVFVNHVGSAIDNDLTNNSASVISYFAPCVDLVVQTFPEFTSVNINQPFNWIVDITNSNTSSNAVNIAFEDIVNPEFTINGTPVCQVTSGNATCIPTFNIVNNIVSGIILNMEAGSTIQIKIPVIAPSFGGAFSNNAQAFTDGSTNYELTPETNISISNVQVLAPTLTKNFSPDIIFVNEESELLFTIQNLASNPSQSNINFIDNLPQGLVLSGSPVWLNANGCTANFSGNSGDTFVGVNNLTFPEGVESCSFSVIVTSSIEGVYLNNNQNFSNHNNIDTSQASATLTVLEDTRDVDIEVIKNVFPEEVSLGDEVDFTITITNLGTTTATSIAIHESLPSGYLYIASSNSIGIYDISSFVWSIDVLNPNQSETLTISAQVISSSNLLNTAFLHSVNEPDRDESNNEDWAEVVLNNCLEIPEGISPNMDGFNDFLVIPCIEDYPNHVIKIFNRLGVQVYENKNYKNNWDGKPNMGFPNTSKLLPVGTYYYILEVEGASKPIIGWVYLNY